MSTLGDIGPKVLVSLLFGVLYGFDSICLGLFGCFGFFGFPDGFYIFKCTLDSSKRLGRGCAPLLNKAFHFTRVSMYKGLPCIIDFPLQVSFPYIYERFPLYTLFLCMWDFLL